MHLKLHQRCRIQNHPQKLFWLLLIVWAACAFFKEWFDFKGEIMRIFEGTVGACLQANTGIACEHAPTEYFKKTVGAYRTLCFIMRSFCLFQSFSLLASRLSCACLPLARAIFTFTRGPFQYISSATIV